MCLRGFDALEAVRLGDSEKARTIHQEILKDWQNASDEYHSLGELAKAQCKLNEALAYLKKALEIRAAAKDWFNVAATMVELGETLEFKRTFAMSLEIDFKAV